MKIRLKMSWGQWSKGHIFTDMPGGQARTLIARSIAEEFPDDKTKYVDRMMRSGRDLKSRVRAAAQ